MGFKFLIDECLSPDLVSMALSAGHPETTCVRNRGWLGLKDHDLMRHVLAEDYTLVTHNARDFRGPTGGPPSGIHARAEIHAGLVCLNSEFPMDLIRQRDLFGVVLTELGGCDDLVNTAIEVFEAADGQISIIRYSIP
ncbi:MAG: DUF5615 family PIN-like protein [Pseudomonadales bacterium]